MDQNEREQMNEDIRQFLIESNENLVTLDDEIVRLEKTPENKKLISSVFRTIHTIKGTCGFFGFDRLSGTAHITENILSQVRAGQRKLTPPLISLVLEAVDKIKMLLLSIETTGGEGEVDCAELIARLEEAHLDLQWPAAEVAVAAKAAAPAAKTRTKAKAEAAPSARSG